MQRRWLYFAFCLILVIACAGAANDTTPAEPAHRLADRFRNPNPDFSRPATWTRVSFMVRRLWSTSVSPRSFVAPRVVNDGAILRAGTMNPSITWVGHATLLIQMNGLNILTDPQWSERASPVSWGGPRRLSPPGIAFGDLPRIHVVLISHDHYDHLDVATVKRLAAEHDPLFLVPLGLKAWFADTGITRVEELDWWQEREYRDVKFVCLPAQHFSQRTLWDANERLWASWAASTVDRRFYFSGDTGYFDGFKEIGQRFAPFDVAAIAIGAYVPPEIMQFVHLTPEQAVQTSIDLGARTMLGIHWGTFDLAEEPLDEPPKRMLAELRRRNIDPSHGWIFKMGETRPW